VSKIEAAVIIHQSWDKAVDADPHKAGGKLTLPGTRFTCAQVLAEMAEWESLEAMASNFDLDSASVRRFLMALSVRLDTMERCRTTLAAVREWLDGHPDTPGELLQRVDEALGRDT
jgi:uncharacterized protein (DUF433 family)